nr:hypothetical protein [Tanacetum cinerariifolium]
MPIAKPNMISSDSARVVSSSSVSKPQSKSNNLKKRVLPNSKSKSISYEFKKHQSSGSLVSNKSNTSNLNVSKPKVKRSLLTSPVAIKSSSLWATPVVEKSRFSVATPQMRRIRNDHFATITGYGDYVQGNLTICHDYYNLEGEDLPTGSRDSNVNAISIFGMAASSLKKLQKKNSLSRRKRWNSKVYKLVPPQSYPCSSRVTLRCGAQITTNDTGTSTTYIPGPITNDEKAQKKNDVKARSMLLMALPNKHLMTFNQYKDAKTLFAAIETRFGEKATKKIQKTIQKQLPKSTNEVPADFGVSTASPQKKIHEGDLEEMDLKWQLALLSIRAKRFFKKTGKKITINESNIAGYDKARVECFNCYSKIVVLKNKLEKISKEKDDLDNKIKKFKNASQSLDKLIGSQITIKSKRGLGYVSYNAVPPLHTGRFSPPRINLSHTGLPEFVEPSVESYGIKPIQVVTQTSSVKISKPVKENNGAPIIEDWESEGEDKVESPPEIERKTVEPSVDKVEVDIPKQNDKPARRPVKYAEMYITQRPRGNQRIWNNLKSHQLGHSHKQLEDQGYFNSGCSRHMTGNISYLTDFKEFDGGYVAFGGGAKVLRKNNMYSVDMKNIVPKKDLTCFVAKATNDESMLWHMRLGHINIKNMNKLVKENLVGATKDETSRILKTFITEIENLVDKKVKIIRCDNRTEFKNRVMNEFCKEKNSILVVKPYFKTPYELFRGRTPGLSFIRPFGFHVTILNTLHHLGKFDGKSDEGLFVGYSTTIKAFRVYNTRTRKVEKNMHIKFLENKPIIPSDRPKWLFDIDTLTESINYIPVITGTNSNDFAGKGARFDASQSSMETEPSQDYILMSLWNDGSLYTVTDSPNQEV